jgi:hypothetical protein
MWGGLHGAAQVWEHMRESRRRALNLPEPPQTPGRVALRRLGTFHFVCLGWVFFRAGSFGTALLMLWRLIVGGFGSSPLLTWAVVLAIGFGIGTQYLRDDAGPRMQHVFSRLPAVAQGVVIGMGLFVITTLGPAGVAPFIYFRF